ncbi:unnamed protein product [Chironomus riparius]|uniref:Ionotropic receptor n=1 Tax=Chironomus riparius TaxID=315576 RepID=A0A9N9S847_9DIPT|nr:unnamed protein product [Chironomus riparius]
MDVRELINPEQGCLVFPNKLKDMMGFTYKIVAYSQEPKVFVSNNTVFSSKVLFIDAVIQHQNASFKLFSTKNLGKIKSLWMSRNYHLFISYGIVINMDVPKLQIYEENGYCALVPLRPKIPVFKSIFVEPFDRLTWLFLALTMACSVFVFWMFGGRGAVDSPWLLAYGIFVMFIGQGVNFSRRNRLVLTILLQLIIFMIWVLSNAYGGILTSFMIEPIQEERLLTFDDLVASNYKIMTDELFARMISGSDSYKILKPRLNTSLVLMTSELSEELARKFYVFIMTCDQAEMIIDKELIRENKTVSKFYYLLPEKFMPFLIQLEASYLNPFLERFQYYMDLSFQAGLPYIWEVFYSKLYEMPFGYNHQNVNVYFQLNDLTQVFSILIIGNVLSALAFLIEIFFHDILAKLNLSYLARKLRNRVHQLAYNKKKQPKHPKYQKGALYYIIHRHKRVKRLKARKLKVRRIYVQPRFPMD